MVGDRWSAQEIVNTVLSPIFSQAPLCCQKATLQAEGPSQLVVSYMWVHVKKKIYHGAVAVSTSEAEETGYLPLLLSSALTSRQPHNLHYLTLLFPACSLCKSPCQSCGGNSGLRKSGVHLFSH